MFGRGRPQAADEGGGSGRRSKSRRLQGAEGRVSEETIKPKSGKCDKIPSAKRYGIGRNTAPSFPLQAARRGLYGLDALRPYTRWNEPAGDRGRYSIHINKKPRETKARTALESEERFDSLLLLAVSRVSNQFLSIIGRSSHIGPFLDVFGLSLKTFGLILDIFGLIHGLFLKISGQIFRSATRRFGGTRIGRLLSIREWLGPVLRRFGEACKRPLLKIIERAIEQLLDTLG